MKHLTARLLRGMAVMTAAATLLTSFATHASAEVVSNDDLAHAEAISALPYSHDVDLSGAKNQPRTNRHVS